MRIDALLSKWHAHGYGLRVRVIVTSIKLSLLVAAVSACASISNPLTQPTEYDTLVPGCASKFAIEWTTQPEPGGTSLLSGHVTRHYASFGALGTSPCASPNAT